MLKTHGGIYIKSTDYASMSALGGDLSSQWLAVVISSVGDALSGSAVSILSSTDFHVSQVIGEIGIEGHVVSSIGDEDFWHDAVGVVG